MKIRQAKPSLPKSKTKRDGREGLLVFESLVFFDLGCWSTAQMNDLFVTHLIYYSFIELTEVTWGALVG